MREATMPTRSLFMYPGYRSVCVLAAITVDTLVLSMAFFRKPNLGTNYQLICLVKIGVLDM